MTKSAKDNLPELFIEYYCESCGCKLVQKRVTRIRCNCGEMAHCSGITVTDGMSIHASVRTNTAMYLPGQLILFEEHRSYPISVSQLVRQ